MHLLGEHHLPVVSCRLLLVLGQVRLRLAIVGICCLQSPRSKVAGPLHSLTSNNHLAMLLGQELRYEMPARTKMRSYTTLLGIYAKEGIVESVNACTSIILELDTWKDAAKRYFLGMVAHGMHDDWSRFQHTFGMVCLGNEEKDANFLKRVVEARLMHWFDHKLLIAGGFSDGESTAKATVELVVKSTSSAFVCPLHTMALAVIDCIGRGTAATFPKASASAAAKDIVRVHALVENIRASAVHTRDLARTLEELDMPELVMLKHNDTRWTGYYQMLSRFVQNFDALRELVKRDTSIVAVSAPDDLVDAFPACTLNDFDQLYLRTLGYVEAFSTIYEVTQQLQKRSEDDADAGAASVGYHVTRVLDHLTATGIDENKPIEVRALADALHSAMSVRLDYVFQGKSAEVRSAMFHPRYFDCCGATISEIKKAQELIITEVPSILPELDTPGLSTAAASMATAALRAGFSFLEHTCDVSRDERPTPEQFWQNDVFSPARPIVQLYLSMPSGSSECERVFSDASFMQDDRQNRLSAGTFEDAVLFRRYMRDKRYSFEGVVQCAEKNRAFLPAQP